MTTNSPPADSSAERAPTFDDMPLSRETRLALAEMGYTQPTPVQRAVFEPAVRGGDLVVQARTGTGKTTAFGLPIVDSLVKKGAPGPQALVLCPTRELALQVAHEIERLGKHREIRTVAIYGGAPMGRQVDQLASSPGLVVGTPGRVLDHLRQGTLDPASVKLLVLDEADEMLSMGFERELSAILERLPKSRQTLLFSATLPPDIERMARDRLREPEFVTLSGDHVGALEIQHFVYLVAGDKTDAMLRMLEVENPESAIVFCNTKAETERVATALQRQGFEADWLNGDLAQSDREQVMSATREGRLRFLVATDVAARGIDISHLTHVINYDFPESAERYVHRTGRTGRAGRTGTAVALVTPKDIGALYLLRLTYKIKPIEKQIPSAGEMRTRAEADLVDMLIAAFGDRKPHPDDLAVARRILTHDAAEAILAGLLRDHLGDRAEASEAAAATRRTGPRLPRSRAEAPTSDRRPARAESASSSNASRDEADSGATAAPARDPSGRRSRGPRRSERAERPARRDDDATPGWVESPAASDAQATPATAREGDAGGGERDARTDPNFVELFVNVGRRDGVGAADLQAMVTRATGLDRDATGRIRVRDRHSFVHVPKDAADAALTGFATETVGGRAVRAERSRPRAAEASSTEAD